MKSGVYSGYGLFSLLLRWGPAFRRNISKTQKIEALRFSAILVVYNETTRHYVSEEDIKNSYIHISKVNVKCTLVEALRLCTGRTAHRGRRALPFHDHGTRRGLGVSVTPRPLFTPRKDPVPIVQEAGWAPGPVWTGAENLNPTGIQSPDRPARSQSLYRLRYPAYGRHKPEAKIKM